MLFLILKLISSGAKKPNGVITVKLQRDNLAMINTNIHLSTCSQENITRI